MWPLGRAWLGGWRPLKADLFTFYDFGVESTLSGQLVFVDLSKRRFFGGQVNICGLIVSGPV